MPILAALLTVVLVAAPASAARKSAAKKPATDKYAAIVLDANTGKTLHAANADAHRFPASLTKMMTLYVLFEELQAKRLTLDSKLSVSKNAASQAPSKLGVRAGSSIKVEDAILSLTTKSANDVAVVIAENVGGSVSGFAGRMNRTARKLGMNSSTFRNPNGLPDPGQKTTARDMARLGQGLQDNFPAYYKYFGVKSFTYKGVRIRNHNRLLGSVEGVDGIKTGYTRASGFNLVTNVRRDGRHVVAVVMGGRTAASRDAEMRKLIAKFLPAARKGDRTAPVVVAENMDGADMTASDPVDNPDTDAGELIAQAAPEEVEVAMDVRVPRSRPDLADGSVSAVGYADVRPPRDLVSAAMAESAAAQGDLTEIDDEIATDAVSMRIAIATEVAALAYAAPRNGRPDDVMARLTEMAQIRAGDRDMVAGNRVIAGAASERASTPARENDGWNIQIGAVPTADGAQALIDKAQDSMGAVLASRQPVTQEVEKNGTTLYRARFAGFEGKEEARAACVKLKSRSISCLAVPS